jgi:hypothetical protein
MAWMRVLVRLDSGRLAAIVEESLRELNFVYLKNMGRNMTQFELQAPCHLIVSVENTTREQLTFLIRPPLRVESALELRPMVGVREPEPDLLRCQSALVRVLRSHLPDEPWKGLGVLRSRSQKANWEKLGES